MYVGGRSEHGTMSSITCMSSGSVPLTVVSVRYVGNYEQNRISSCVALDYLDITARIGLLCGVRTCTLSPVILSHAILFFLRPTTALV